MEQKPRVIVIGAGYAGKRFIKVLSYLREKNSESIDFIGIIDVSEEKLADIPTHLKTETSLHKALEDWKPDVAVVCVNEYRHHEVLDELCKSSVKAILCEKPLTSTLHEAHDIQRKLGDRFISLNLVERFSPIVASCRNWLSEAPEISIRRVEFFWGKYRVRDPRPSIGVCSEAIHPIDLIQLLFGRINLDTDVAMGVVADMQSGQESVMDSVSVLFGGANFPVVGQSSFAWPERDRRVVAFAGDGKNLYLIRLEFDNPRWDCDSLKIFKIDPETGKKELVYEVSTTNSDFPDDLNQIYKVFLFVQESLKLLGKEDPAVPLVQIEEAINLQAILDEISRKAKTRQACLTD